MKRPNLLRSGLLVCHLVLACVLLLEFRPGWPWSRLQRDALELLYAVQIVLAVAWAVLRPRPFGLALLPFTAAALLAWYRLTHMNADAAEFEFAFDVVLASATALVAWVVRELGWRVFTDSQDNSLVSRAAGGNWQFSLASLMRLTLVAAVVLFISRWVVSKFDELSIYFPLVATPFVVGGMAAFFAILPAALSWRVQVASIATSFAITYFCWWLGERQSVREPVMLTLSEAAVFLPTLWVLRRSGVRYARIARSHD